MPSDPAPLVGVTGGIGSGKSTVCRRFQSLGRTVLSADLIARELTDTDAGVRKAITEKFGREMYAADGHLQRSELASAVFGSPAKLRALNAIVHPHVFSSLKHVVAQLPEASRTPYVVVEAALIFESGMDGDLDATIVVRAPESVRLERVERRDGLTREEVRARMRSQLPEEESARRADFVIDNAGPESGLGERVAFIDRLLSLMLGGSGRQGKP